MAVIDMHCDTLMIAYLRKINDIYSMRGMLDIQRMAKGDMMAQFFAAFLLRDDVEKMIPGFVKPQDREYVEACASILSSSIVAHSDIIARATTADEIEANYAGGKMSAVLTIEDGRIVDNKLENIDWLYELGVRAVSLTWNEANCFGSPNSMDDSIMKLGLTDFGKEAVVYMQHLGMLVDVSHLSDGGFEDVAALCKKPFVATHSNCRALCPHPRNLTDEMIRKLANSGGVMGLNFCPEFLNADVACKSSKVELIVSMAQHAKNIGGVDVVSFGSDFDGIQGELEIDGCDKYPVLFDALKNVGFSEAEVEKIAHGNVLRIMKDAVM